MGAVELACPPTDVYAVEGIERTTGGDEVGKYCPYVAHGCDPKVDGIAEVAEACYGDTSLDGLGLSSPECGAETG